MFEQKLIRKIKKKSLNIGIIGVGYVGIKLVIGFTEIMSSIVSIMAKIKLIF